MSLISWLPLSVCLKFLARWPVLNTLKLEKTLNRIALNCCFVKQRASQLYKNYQMNLNFHIIVTVLVGKIYRLQQGHLLVSMPTVTSWILTEMIRFSKTQLFLCFSNVILNCFLVLMLFNIFFLWNRVCSLLFWVYYINTHWMLTSDMPFPLEIVQMIHDICFIFFWNSRVVLMSNIPQRNCFLNCFLFSSIMPFWDHD